MEINVTCTPETHRATLTAQRAGCEILRTGCAIGAKGASAQKREGDNKTPLGCFALRRLWYRPDREGVLRCALPTRAITRESGWSDDPQDPLYNRPIVLPHKFSHEKLWREDRLYDVFFELGINDDPPIRGHGSALFLHLARKGFLPTEGCIAISRADFGVLIANATPRTRIIIRLAPQK